MWAKGSQFAMHDTPEATMDAEFFYRLHGEYALLWAASKGFHWLAKRIITSKKGTNINFADESGRTALARVIENYEPNTEKSSLRPNGVDFAGIAELLLKHPDTDLSDKANGIPMLDRAITKGCYTVVERLLEYHKAAMDAVAQAGPDAVIPDVYSRVVWCQYNSANAIHFIPTQYFDSFGTTTCYGLLKDGQTPLMKATLCGHRDIVELLLRSGADVNEKSGRITGFDDKADSSPEETSGFRWTAINLAARNGDDEFVRLLLECPDIKTDVDSTIIAPSNGTDQNYYSRRRCTANMSQDVLNHLLNSDYTTRNVLEYPQDALYWAVKHGHDQCVHELLDSIRVSITQEKLAALQLVNTEEAIQGYSFTIDGMLTSAERH
ncbi:hypothetical protein NQ176_g1289 [Zarea fungicola]|uniref:Uncharacterized protein n=1 Tax=Zarea fungicola TaxID=93591 RepID=A0ACC1NVK5_9HYPO|nr:hypothetical protein NQ176_g1289 [Lecanicillium fungicola]